MPKVPKGSKYRAVGEEVPFGGELGIVQKSKNVPNFSKQGEAIGKTRGRKQTKEAKAKAEPKKNLVVDKSLLGKASRNDNVVEPRRPYDICMHQISIE